MWSVDATGARSLSATVVLILLATSLVIDTRPAVRGADKPGVQSLPAALAKAIRDGDLNAVSAQLDGGVNVNALDADGNTPLLLAAVYAGCPPSRTAVRSKGGKGWGNSVPPIPVGAPGGARCHVTPEWPPGHGVAHRRRGSAKSPGWASAMKPITAQLNSVNVLASPEEPVRRGRGGFVPRPRRRPGGGAHSWWMVTFSMPAYSTRKNAVP
jgi:hypothetical protein